MGVSNKAVYQEAFDRARTGRGRTLLQRILFRFQDHYTQASREKGEHDGAALLAEEAAKAGSAPTASQAQN
jgi:TPP-dependent pyruvate/acetoin dehydrogenase alpha subunit